VFDATDYLEKIRAAAADMVAKRNLYRDQDAVLTCANAHWEYSARQAR